MSQATAKFNPAQFNPDKLICIESSRPWEMNSNQALGMRFLRVAWLAILLGIFLELVLLVVKSIGQQSAGPQFYAADLAQKVSWSLVVCIGVAVGQSVGRVLQPFAAGVVGLLVSPLAFAAAKGIHKAVGSSLQIAVPAAGQIAPSPGIIALVKGVEFAMLGVLLAWIATQAWAGFRTHIASGLATGIVFGSALVKYTYLASSPRPDTVTSVAMALNELIYPIGCSCVIYSSSKLGQRFGPK